MVVEEIVTKEDLRLFRIQLLDDIKKMLDARPKEEEMQEWLRSGEVKKILKVSASTLQNLRIGGQLKPVKIKGTWYYSLSELNELFKKGGGI